ncbi:MAG: hypothetical protein ACP6IS_01250 [Candidatus Asgardarchaeia archaeon]
MYVIAGVMRNMEDDATFIKKIVKSRGNNFTKFLENEDEYVSFSQSARKVRRALNNKSKE